MKMLLIGTIIKNRDIVGLRIIDKDDIKPDNYFKGQQPKQLTVVDATLSQVKVVLKKGNIIEGIEIDQSGELKGTNGSFERYPKFDANTLNCIENAIVILDKVGERGYSAILVDKTIRLFKTEDIIAGVLNNKINIANGSIKKKTNNSLNSKNPSDYFISSIRGEYNTITENEYAQKAGIRFKEKEITHFNEKKFKQELEEVKKREVKVEQKDVIKKTDNNSLPPLLNYHAVYGVDPKVMEVKDKHGMTIEQKIFRAISIIKDKKPFYYCILSQVKIQYKQFKDNPNYLMRTDCCSSIFINPYTTISIPLPYIIFMLLHECNHICMMHGNRLTKEVNDNIANIAEDIYINEYLIDDLRLNRVGYYQRFLDADKLEALKKNGSLVEVYNPKDIEEKQIELAQKLLDDMQNYKSVASTNMSVDRNFIAFNPEGLCCKDVDLKNDTVEDIYIELMSEYYKNNNQQEDKEDQEENQENNQEEDQESQEENQEENLNNLEGQSESLDTDQDESSDESNTSNSNQSSSNSNSENKEDNANNENKNIDSINNDSDSNSNNNEQEGNEQEGNDSSNMSSSNNSSRSSQNNSNSSNSKNSDKQSENKSNNTESNENTNENTNESDNKNEDSINFRGKQIPLNKKNDKQKFENRVLNEEEALKNIAEQSLKSDDLIETEETANKSIEDKRDDIRRLMHNAIEMYDTTKSFSLGSTDAMYLMAKKELAPKVKWQTILKKYLTKASSKIYTYTAPDKRFLSRDKIMPGPRKMDPSNLEDIVICIDTSGSISSKELGQALTQIQQLFKKYKAEGNLIYWDTEVLAEYKFKNIKEILESKPMGGGGTDVNCVFDYYNTKEYRLHKKQRPQLLIIFTDGYLGEINKAYMKLFKSTLWIISEKGNNSFKPPFGIVAPFKN